MLSIAEMDGYDATTQIRLRPDLGHQAVKIIALTAAAIEGDKQKCLDYGMEYVTSLFRSITR